MCRVVINSGDHKLDAANSLNFTDELSAIDYANRLADTYPLSDCISVMVRVDDGTLVVIRDNAQ